MYNLHIFIVILTQVSFERATTEKISEKCFGMAKQAIEESELVWQYFRRRNTGTFVEVGANHPTIRSQSWFLENHGWTGVLIEPNPHHCRLLRELRPGSQVFEMAVGAPGGKREATLHLLGGDLARQSKLRSEGEDHDSREIIRVQIVTLNDVLEQSGISKIDFISLDIEGLELDALAGFSFEKYRPALFSIEDFCENFDKKRYMRRVGYKLIRRVGYNNWYVPRETPVSVFTVSTRRELIRLIRKDFLSVPFIKAQRKFRALGKER